jgi:streptogramin lyase
MRRLGATLAVAVASGLLAGPAPAATPTAREFSEGITPASSPNSIAAGADGNLWFTEFNGNRIGRITPAGAVTEFSGITAGGHPSVITAGPDGNLWFTEADQKNIGRITPSGEVDEFPTGIVANAANRGIAAGPDGNLWFTNEAGVVGKMTPAGVVPNRYATGITGFPGEIATGADGNLWFTETDSDLNEPNDHKIARITPEGTVTKYEIPDEPGQNQNGPRDIAAGPDGKLWFTLGPDGIGRIDPNAPDPEATITRFTAGITGNPNGIIAGPDGNLWFTGSGTVGRITPSGAATEFSAGTSDDPTGIVAGPDGNLWFTEFFSQRIGRINTGVDPARFADPARIEVPASGITNGPADPYPSTIPASRLQGTVTDVSVRLHGLHHSWADDVEVLLVGPQGQKAVLLADSGVESTRDVVGERSITFDDEGLASPEWLVSGVFQPRHPLLGGDPPVFSPPAPAGPYAGSLSTFDGTNPNGDWKLFVQDDTVDETGVITGGWSLDIETTGPPPVQVQGPPVQVKVPGPPRTVTRPGRTVTVTPAPDAAKPAIRLGRLAARMPQKTFRKGFRVRVTPSEAVTLDVQLSVKPKRVTLAAADSLTLFERTVEASGATSVRVKPSARRLGRPKKRFRALLRIVATDKAGNRTTVTRRLTVNPDRKKTSRKKR